MTGPRMTGPRTEQNEAGESAGGGGAGGGSAPASRARTAVKGVAWNYSGSVLAVLLQLGYTAVTSRLVAPAAFGAYATAVTVAGLLGYLANTGIGTCLLSAGRLTRQLTSLALRIGLAGGVACAL
ncbi:hypothetical protein P8605_48790, partial [Streptomyces sp. T-3]|nr:hypothetical protein [Streptomyces sp. T-3]